jgi:hypothetical protein
MSSPSNLYAEKVFAEHPTALWALDDQADFISLISEAKRQTSQWTITGGSVPSVLPSILDEPFSASNTIVVQGTPPGLLPYSQVKLVSPNLVNVNQLDSLAETFSVSSYVYAKTASMLGIRIGYQYTDGSETIENLKLFETTAQLAWNLVSETFPIPSISSAQIRMVIEIYFVNTGSVDPADYEFRLNGMTAGQWSEEFNATSIGVESEDLPSDSPYYSINKAVPAKAYGFQDLDAYYLVNKNKLCAKNSSIPMVYGASGVTVITPNVDSATPSIIFPANGILNDNGRYKEYTIEMWLKIDSKATEPRKIFGPIASSDGIYVDGPFLVLQVGDNIRSHFVTEWSRPMLVHLRVMKDTASMLVNGEQVISLDFITKDLDLADPLQYNKDQDWLGFWAHEDVPTIHLDCFAIYSYQVPTLVAKRRFLYGQAVELPETMNSAYGGTAAYIDYAFADYTNNYRYPDMGSWGQGIIENLSSQNSVLSTPDYSPPTVVLDQAKESVWLSELALVQDEDVPFINFNEYSGYLFFEKLNAAVSDTKGIYGIFSIKELSSTEQVLFSIRNNQNGNYLSANVVNAQINYVLSYSGAVTTLYSEDIAFIDSPIVAGLDIKKVKESFGGKVAAFLGSPAQLSVYVGGNQDFSQTFTGNIYKFGFSTERNFSKISDNFVSPVLNAYPQVFDAGDVYFGNDSGFWHLSVDGGAPGSFSIDSLFAHTASYTLVPRMNGSSLYLDIATDSYWEDYLPLTYFGQYVIDNNGDSVYDLDFIQFNIGYPVLANFANDKYDTTGALVKSYISFQYISSGANASMTYFTKTELPPANGVIQPGTNVIGYTEDANPKPIYDSFMNTKYEVVDGMVIYPPVGVNFRDLAIVTHIEIQSSGILNKPVKVKSLEYASQAFNDYTSNPVGTRFGVPIYPYRKYGSYFDYGSKNPFRIYKGSTPYLYLTGNSGIEKVGDYDPLVNRGFTMPLNQNLADAYKLVAMQAFIKYGKESFPTTPVQIFEIESKNYYLKFYLVANDVSGKRAKIYAVNAKTGSSNHGLIFYINGKVVREPAISLNEWTTIGITFGNILDLDSFVGGFRVTGPILINNISHYQSTNLQESQRKTKRPWLRVAQDAEGVDNEWLDWETQTWNEVLIVSSITASGVSPDEVYKAYTGTNKFVIDDYSSSEPKTILTFNNYEYRIYQDISWQSQILDSV